MVQYVKQLTNCHLIHSHIDRTDIIVIMFNTCFALIIIINWYNKTRVRKRAQCSHLHIYLFINLLFIFWLKSKNNSLKKFNVLYHLKQTKMKISLQVFSVFHKFQLIVDNLCTYYVATQIIIR